MAVFFITNRAVSYTAMLNRSFSATDDSDRIKSGTLEFGGKHTAGIRTGNGAGQVRFGHYHVARTGGGSRPVSDPVAIIIMFSGDKGSHLGSTNLFK